MASSFSDIPKEKLLESIRIAAPCKADWNAMTGDERVRFCGQCKLNVYNLSEMTRQEATDLVVAKEGKLCVRFYQRADGTVITQNCPVGLRKLRDAVHKLATVVASALSFVLSIGGAFAKEEIDENLAQMIKWSKGNSYGSPYSFWPEPVIWSGNISSPPPGPPEAMFDTTPSEDDDEATAMEKAMLNSNAIANGYQWTQKERRERFPLSPIFGHPSLHSAPASPLYSLLPSISSSPLPSPATPEIRLEQISQTESFELTQTVKSKLPNKIRIENKVINIKAF